MTKKRCFDISGIRHSVIPSPFVIRHSSFRAQGAFTLIELMIVVAIIIALAGLVLGTASYAQKKGARSRAESEVAAIAAALESYKADNGGYPRDGTTDTLDPRSSTDPANYKTQSLFLYTQLSGSTASRQPIPNARTYLAFKPNQLYPTDQTQAVQYLSDPFGNSYGYSTAYQANPASGYNPTFDLWSTGGDTAGKNLNQWIKNW